jgi:hypothetical protein
MFVLHVWYPILSTIVNTCIVALWAVSIAGQAGPDHSDPEYPSNIAWYINKSCDYASPYGAKHYCLMAKGTFAVSVFLLCAPSVSAPQKCSDLLRSQIYLLTQPPPRHLVDDSQPR